MQKLGKPWANQSVSSPYTAARRTRGSRQGARACQCAQGGMPHPLSPKVAGAAPPVALIPPALWNAGEDILVSAS